MQWGKKPTPPILAPALTMAGLRDAGQAVGTICQGFGKNVDLETTGKSRGLGHSERLSRSCGDVARPRSLTGAGRKAGDGSRPDFLSERWSDEEVRARGPGAASPHARGTRSDLDGRDASAPDHDEMSC